MLFSGSIRKFVISTTMIIALVYLGYRGIFTFNLESGYAIFASALLLGAETWGVFLMALYFLQVWDTSHPDPVAPPEGCTVDVFLPTYNEDAQLLRGSINALNQLDYPHKTYVLDDGNRSEVKELCEEMGVYYIARENNIHAKAGNLNNALDQTDGEFVIIFDADHIAKPNFISRIIGYFQDEKLGFIQTPHAFYNFDNFQAHVNYKKGLYWEEGQLFYNVIQPGKNYWNANVFCGSAAMFRRKALEEVGLIAVETITEDMHTGLRVHSKGWKSLFVNERMILAQAAPDITTFASQRMRWGEGNLSIFAYDNPLTIPGLTLTQRLNYLGSMLGWTTGVAKLCLYLTPILMLFSGVSPVSEFTPTLLLVTLAYLFATWIAVKVASDGYGRLWDIEVQAMTNFWLQCKALYLAVTRRGRGRFVVTNKRGRQGNDIVNLIRPHLILIALGVGAIVWAGTKIALGASDDYFGLSVGTFLIGIQSIMAFQVVRKAFRPADKRYSWRHPSNELHVAYQADGVSGQGVSIDINEMGLGFVSYKALQPGSIVDVTVSAEDRQVGIKAEVRSCQSFGKLPHGLEAHRVGLQFVEPTGEQLNDVWTIVSRVAVERQYDRLDRNGELRKDKASRFAVQLFGEGIQLGTVARLCKKNCLRFDDAGHIPANTRVRFVGESPVGQFSGEGIVREINGASQSQLDIDQFDGQSRSLMYSISSNHHDASLRKVVRSTPSKQKQPFWKPSIEAGWVSLAASVICAAMAWYVWQDQYFLTDLASRQQISEDDRSRVRMLVEDIFDPNGKTRTPAAMFEARNVLKLMGDHDEVAKLEELILEEMPNDVGIQLARANRLLEAKNFNAAAGSFLRIRDQLDAQELYATSSQRRDILLGLARSSVGNGDRRDAIRSYREGLRISADPQATLELANLLVEHKEFEEIRGLLSDLPDGPETKLIQARVNFIDRKFAETEAILESLVSEIPGNFTARQMLASSYSESGKIDQAIRQLQMLVRSNFNVHDSQMQIVRLSILDQRLTEGVDQAMVMQVRPTEDADFWAEVVNAVRESDVSSEEYIALVDRIYRTEAVEDSESVALQSELAEYFASRDQLEKAIPLFESCTILHPSNHLIRKRYAEVLHDAGRFLEADKEYERLLLGYTSPPSAEPVASQSKVVPATAVRPTATTTTLPNLTQAHSFQ